MRGALGPAILAGLLIGCGAVFDPALQEAVSTEMNTSTLKCGDTSVAFRQVTIDGFTEDVTYSGLRLARIQPEAVSEADRLNGVSGRAIATYSYRAIRSRLRQNGTGWTIWETPASPTCVMTYELRQSSGGWMAVAPQNSTGCWWPSAGAQEFRSALSCADT